jgi:nicotinamide-nucleotide amidase
MRAEIIAIGTELLLGQIVDTNSSWMGEQLALAGIDSHFQTKVGDNLERIIEAIRHGLSRSDALILCGGLGPTQDDITREAIARVMGVTLIRRPEIAEHIRKLFEARGREMAPSNLRQADVPEGASPIKEMPGTAPGLLCPLGRQVIYAVPGVPSEMRAMMTGTILPDLQARAGLRAVIRSRVLRTWGHTESGLADLLAERITELDQTGNPTLAFQASGIEGIKVRITAKAESDATALAILADEEARLRLLMDPYIFGIDEQTMETVVLERLRQARQSLAIAESLTGGLAGQRLSRAAILLGAAGVSLFKGALVTADPTLRTRLLGAPEGAARLAPETVMAAASGVRRLLGAEIGLAAEGVVGPEPEDGLAPGTVRLGLAIGERLLSHEVRLPGNASRIREYTVISLLNALRQELG